MTYQTPGSVEKKKDIFNLIEEDFFSICKTTIDIFPLLVPQRVTFNHQPLDSERVLHKLVSDDSVTSIILMGEGGSGKTSRLIHFTHYLFSEFKEGRFKKIPIYVPLRTVTKDMYSGRMSLQDNFLVKFLFKSFGSVHDQRTISSWLLERDILLVLDGYDELEQHFDGFLNTFPSLLKLLSNCQLMRMKVIIGTRKSVVETKSSIVSSAKSSKKQRKTASENFLNAFFYLRGDLNSVKLLNVIPLEREGVFDYLERFVEHHQLFRDVHGDFALFKDDKEEVNESRYRQILEEIPSLVTLCSNPNMMGMVFKHLPRIYSELMKNDETSGKGEVLEMTRVNLFEAVTSAWFEREARRIIELGTFERVVDSSIVIQNIIQIYATNLARQQFERGRMKQTVSEIESLDHQLLRGIDKSLRSRIQEEDALKVIRRSCLTFVTSDQYMFFHNSIIEFLAMQNCVEEIRGMGEWLFQHGNSHIEGRRGRDSFFTKFISSEDGVLRFMVEKLRESLKTAGTRDKIMKETEKTLLGQLFFIIDLSKQFPDLLSIASSNALTILCSANVSLSGMDFRGIVARNTVFFKALLDGTDFSLADLTGSTFIKCLLWNTKFNGTCLRECSFDLKHIVDEVKFQPNLSRQSNINVLSSSHSGKYFASSSPNTVRVWNNLGKKLFSVSFNTSFLCQISAVQVSSIVSLFYGDRFLLLGLMKISNEIIIAPVGNDVIVVDIENQKIDRKVNSYFKSLRVDRALYVTLEFPSESCHTSSGFSYDILIWYLQSDSDKGSIVIYSVNSRKIVNTIPNFVEKKSSYYFTDNENYGNRFCSNFDGRLVVVGLSDSIVIMNHSGRNILHRIPLIEKGGGVDYLRFFDTDYLVVKMKEDNIMEEEERSSDIARQNEDIGIDVYRIEVHLHSTVNYTSRKISVSHESLETKIYGHPICFSSNKPLYLRPPKSRRDCEEGGGRKVLEIVDYTTNKVEGKTVFMKGEFLFHPFENILLFGRDMEQTQYKKCEGSQASIFLSTNHFDGLLSSSSFTGIHQHEYHFDSIRVGCNKKCLIFSKPGKTPPMFMLYSEYLTINIQAGPLLELGIGVSKKLFDAVVNFTNEVISVSIDQEYNLEWTNHKNMNNSSSIRYNCKKETTYKIDNLLGNDCTNSFGIVLDRTGYRILLKNIPGDIYLFEVGRDGKKKNQHDQETSFKICCKKIIKCAKFLPSGGIVKELGSFLGTIKNFYWWGCFGMGDDWDRVQVFNMQQNQAETWDIRKKKRVKYKPLPTIVSGEPGIIQAYVEPSDSSFFVAPLLQFREGRVSKRSVTSCDAEYQYLDGKLRVCSIRLELSGKFPPTQLEMRNVFGISLRNCELLGKYCKKNEFIPHFGYINHPAISIDPLKDLERGDVLMKFIDHLEGERVPLLRTHASNATQVGYLVDETISQFLKGKKKKLPHKALELIHAAVYVGDGKIIEASGKTSVVCNLISEKKKMSDYMVFRLIGKKRVAEKVSLFCKKISLEQKNRESKSGESGKKLFYNGTGALLSVIFKPPKEGEEKWKEKYDRILKREKKVKKKYFCSELVVHVYHLAAALLQEERVIHLKASSAHPKELYESLKKDDRWEYVGNVINTPSSKTTEEKEEMEGELEETNKIDGGFEQSGGEICVWKKNIKIVEDYWKITMKEHDLLNAFSEELKKRERKSEVEKLVSKEEVEGEEEEEEEEHEEKEKEKGICYSNGDRYNGEWNDEKKNGRGIYYFRNGDRYEGEWKNDEKNGKGVFYHKNGDRYDGRWRDDKRFGRGIFYHNDGERYEGWWKDGKKNGKGVFFHNNGDRYDGWWKDGKKSGKGVFHYNNGDRYEGGWKDDQREGRGVHQFFSLSEEEEDGGKYSEIRLYENGEISKLFSFLEKNGVAYCYDKMKSDGVKYEDILGIFLKKPETLTDYIPQKIHRVKFLESLKLEKERNRRVVGLISGEYNWNGKSFQIKQNFAYFENRKYEFEILTGNVYKILIGDDMFVFIWDDEDKMLRVVRTKGGYKFIKRVKAFGDEDLILGEYNWSGKSLEFKKKNVYLGEERYPFEELTSKMVYVVKMEEKKFVFNWDQEDRVLGVVEVEGEGDRFFEKIDKIVYTKIIE